MHHHVIVTSDQMTFRQDGMAFVDITLRDVDGNETGVLSIRGALIAQFLNDLVPTWAELEQERRP